MRCYPGVSGYCTHEYCCKNGAFQDPHLAFANGGRADFRGRNGMFYNFLSAPDLAVNVKIEDAKFLLGNTMSAEKKVTVDGSFITEVHIVARVGGAKRKFANISFWASELNDQNWGWKTVNGTCGGNFFRIGKQASKQCEELTCFLCCPGIAPLRPRPTGRRWWKESSRRCCAQCGWRLLARPCPGPRLWPWRLRRATRIWLAGAPPLTLTHAALRMRRSTTDCVAHAGLTHRPTSGAP